MAFSGRRPHQVADHPQPDFGRRPRCTLDLDLADMDENCVVERQLLKVEVAGMDTQRDECSSGTSRAQACLWSLGSRVEIPPHRRRAVAARSRHFAVRRAGPRGWRPPGTSMRGPARWTRGAHGPLEFSSVRTDAPVSRGEAGPAGVRPRCDLSRRLPTNQSALASSSARARVLARR